MREILFRAKTVGSLKWVEGFYFREAGNFIKELPSAVSTETHMVYEDTVGQYTGLTDKNGKKIFEGDILKQYGFCYVVSYNDGTFIAYETPYNEGAVIPRYDWQFAKVIGNIHDNPELLKEGAIE